MLGTTQVTGQRLLQSFALFVLANTTNNGSGKIQVLLPAHSEPPFSFRLLSAVLALLRCLAFGWGEFIHTHIFSFLNS